VVVFFHIRYGIIIAEASSTAQAYHGTWAILLLQLLLVVAGQLACDVAAV